MRKLKSLVLIFAIFLVGCASEMESLSDVAQNGQDNRTERLRIEQQEQTRRTELIEAERTARQTKAAETVRHVFLILGIMGAIGIFGAVFYFTSPDLFNFLTRREQAKVIMMMERTKQIQIASQPQVINVQVVGETLYGVDRWKQLTEWAETNKAEIVPRNNSIWIVEKDGSEYEVEA